jgi:tetratricopeptide (TPR) repeat protein
VETDLPDLSDTTFIEAAEAQAEALPDTLPTSPTEALPDILAREGIPHHDPRFHDYYEEAQLALEDGSPGDAIDALRMAVFDTPDSAVTWLLLGQTYGQVGRTRQGLDCVEEALRHDRYLPEAHRFMAQHWLRRGEPARARPHSEELARVLPNDSSAAALLGRTYMGLSMWSESIASARRSISLSPQEIGPYNTVGFSALQLGRNELAVQYLEAATELEGLAPYMLNNLGLAYERTERNTDALQAFGDAVALDPGYSIGRANRDRVRVVVDQEVADEVARILSARARQAGAGRTASATGSDFPNDEATP